MKHIKTYEVNYLPSVSKGKEVMEFISKELGLNSKVDYLDYGDSVKIYITVNTINTNFYVRLNDFFENFEECDLLIEPHYKSQLTIHIVMSGEFVDKLLIKMDSNKYNL